MQNAIAVGSEKLIRIALASAFALACSTVVGAQNRPVATAVRLTGHVVLDGRLDEAAWSVAPVARTFRQQRPNDGAAATERTEVRFLFDDDAIYIGARMYESRGRAGVTSRLARHDADVPSDVLRIDFDTYHDRLHSVEFDVNPAGWRGDATDVDRSWDPVWEAATAIDSLGWTAEMRIPFSQLHFSRDSIQAWGLNVTRIEQSTQERDLWAYWSQKDAGGASYFGDLVGLRISRAPERAEFLPYVVTRAKRISTGDPSSPFNHPKQNDVRVGGDVKLLLNNSFTLAATVNPDFGQVEVDPAVVNLSAYETFFPEKRPFFVEGGDIFSFGQPGCHINCGFGLFPFYSRRIGRAPQGGGIADSIGRFSDIPENTTILGATKLTGRTPGGFSVAAIDAVSQRADAAVETPAGQRFGVPVEPLTNNFVGRVKQDLLGGNLVIGAIATSVDRRITTNDLSALLPKTARTAGADVDAFWSQHRYHFYAAVSASDVMGDSLAIGRLERSSARYLQRPDRNTMSDGIFTNAYNPSATSLTGYGAIARLAKDGGNWIGDLNAASVSPGYETNDLGFLQKADWRWLNGSLGRQFTTPTRWYQNLTLMTGAEQYVNFEGDVTERDIAPLATVTFANYWNLLALWQHDFEAVADKELRGGPAVLSPANDVGLIQIGSDPRRSVVLGANTTLVHVYDGGFSNSLGANVTFNPASNVQVTVGPGYSSSMSPAQYVTAIPDTTARAFYGLRYVFSRLDQRQLSMTVRGGVTFTPSLSLDLYAQPLIASGHYSGFEEYAAPRTLRRLVYGRDVGTSTEVRDGTGAVAEYRIDPDGTGPAAPFTIDSPDFNFRSLRGTGVLRWEWRPGSTAYLVWTQTRSGTAPIGDLELSRDRSALFAAPADNIFVLKISYWLGM
jgi:hypothetical protein